MIYREFPTILKAWRGLVDELIFEPFITLDPYWEKPYVLPAINWGMHAAYPDMLEVRIENPAVDENLNLGMSSYTKTRWRMFMKKYFRPDFSDWVNASIDRLEENPHRPYVAAYSPNINEAPKRMSGRNFSGGPRAHNYGGCIGSVQIRIRPEPKVILYSRACALDKTGFIDLCLIHHVSKRLADRGYKVGAIWVISLGFISAVSQIFYIDQFKIPLKNHSLKKRISHLLSTGSDHNYGPLKRIYKRRDEMRKGGIPKSVKVSQLSLGF